MAEATAASHAGPAPGRRSAWSEVRLGAVLVTVGLVLLFTMWVQRGRNPFAEAYSLVLFVEDAKGLQEGAPVTLSGLNVGEVKEIGVLRPGSPLRGRDPGRPRSMNIRVVLEVDEEYRHEITNRSVARISSQGASGNRYVRLEKGPVGGTPLESGDRIPVGPSFDVDQLVERAGEVLNRLESLNRNAAGVREKMKSGRGTLGRFMATRADNEVAENFEEMNVRAARVMRSIDQGGGTIALERRTRRIRSNVDRLQETLEAIRRKAGAEGGSLGKLASDTTLTAALVRLEAKAAALEAVLSRGRGSLGRFLNDPELYDQLSALTAQLDSLAAQVAEDPLGSVNVELR